MFLLRSSRRPSDHGPARRAIAAGTVLTTSAAACLVLASAPPGAQAAPLPTAFAAEAHGDLVALRSELASQPLAATYVGHARVQADSEGGLDDPEGGASVPSTARVHAESSNVDVQLLGEDPTIQPDVTEAVAPPPSDPPGRTLLDVPLGPLADVGVVRGDVAANYVSDTACPPASSGRRLLGSARTEAAGVTLLGVAGLPVANVGQIGASHVESRTELVDTTGPGDAVRSTSTLRLGAVSLLGGLVQVRLSDPVALTAESNGTTSETTVTNTTAEVSVAGVEVLTLEPDGRTVPVPVDLGVAAVDLRIGLFDAEEVTSATTATADLGAVLSLDLGVRLLGTDLVDLHLGVGELAVSATAPAGGVECDPAAPFDTDGDGLSDEDEEELGTDPTNPDTDGDGLTDGAETTTHGTDPLDPDTDDGGVTDGAEVDNGTNPVDNPDDDLPTTDTDGDGLTDEDEDELGTDPTNPDTDGDGLTDGTEVNTVGTDPLDPDTDDGGVTDGAEVDNGTNPVDNPDDDVETPGDTDGDGLTDDEEEELGTDPNHPDTDRDGLTDLAETTTATRCATGSTNPRRRDTDGDGLGDGAEFHGIFLSQVRSFNRGRPRKAMPIGLVRTDPCRRDTDGDRLSDGQEVRGSKIRQRVVRSADNGGAYKIRKRQTDPTRADTDRDKLTDRQEVKGSKNKRFNKRRSDPTRADTDWGGARDGREVKSKTDPTRHG